MPNPQEIQFIPAPDCENLPFCRKCQTCWRAEIIRGTGDPAESGCHHPEAVEARRQYTDGDSPNSAKTNS